MRYWLLKNLVVVPLLRLLWRFEVHGVHNIPKNGAAIIASNHVGILDSAFVPGAMPRHVAFLVKEQWFAGKGFVASFRRGFMRAMGQLEIDRGGGSASEISLGSGIAVLSAGKLLGIYPEGTRSPDGRLHRGRTGVARMLLEMSVPVVPVAVLGTAEIMPRGAKFPKLGGRVIVTFGEPMDFSRYVGLTEDRFVLRAITDEIMHEIRRLSGQEYVDVYASNARRPARKA
ncbi:lysophospholipid acyltransferase family protein [Pseudolysinimonas yzui]|uniref:1-acyl-sn-glycerol-3-phosphate acyltransferase n=1 Tax=Pseudolysinimonas yzui TaxID=2708254 RepID=A0A8J3DU39_9MICO|nr:lysophospholipid acyltransferase family protein [Pseudolysinimonas yzui]GHF04585.1 1-acyl-sn-glycerol-3-phosphate acyltransferase [Pseudolysinimonas yzui]